jgi:endoglucanase
MELGATELASAVGPGAQQSIYLQQAAQWASSYLTSSDQDSLNLYDVGGLAHYELARLISSTGATGLAVTVPTLVGQLHSQIEQAIAVGAKNPFAFGYPWGASDTVSHGAGLSVMASEYDALTGTDAFATQAQGWMDNILGANPWGVSFIVGDGTTFPRCIQHQVANLVGSTDGSSPVLAGAAVEGPTKHASRGQVSGMVACPGGKGSKSDPYAQFNGHGSVYKDSVQSYSTNEPALDLTAATPLAMAWLSASGS